MSIACGLTVLVGLLVAVVWSSLGSAPPREAPAASAFDRGARTYLALARALAERDPLSGDASRDTSGDSGSGEMPADEAPTSQSGPRPRQPGVANVVTRPAGPGRRLSFAEITEQAGAAATLVVEVTAGDVSSAVRRQGLIRGLRAIGLRAAQLGGRRLALDEELQGLYGVSRSPLTAESVTPLHVLLGDLLPGRGSLLDRFTRFEEQFQVPRDRLPDVFTRAMAACRARTVAHVALPPTESIAIEYGKGAAWSGFSTYRGHYRSRIRVNTDYPQSVDRLLDLACHEGYPGHHTASVLRDQASHRGTAWAERSIMPTFTPDAYAAEAAASQAAALAFGEADRISLEQNELFPAAGLDPAGAERYVRVMRLVARLDQSIAAAIERYLAGELDFPDALSTLKRDALMAHPEALLMFVNRHRGYALAYVSGPTTIRRAIEAGATEDELWANVVNPFDRP